MFSMKSNTRKASTASCLLIGHGCTEHTGVRPNEAGTGRNKLIHGSIVICPKIHRTFFAKYFTKKVYIISPTNQKRIQNYKIQAKEGHVAPGYIGLLSARIRTLPPPDIGIDHYTHKSHERRRCRSVSIACCRAQLLAAINACHAP